MREELFGERRRLVDRMQAMELAVAEAELVGHEGVEEAARAELREAQQRYSELLRADREMWMRMSADAQMRASAAALLHSRWRSARLLAQVGWVAHFDACAERHEYELDPHSRMPVLPTPEELERAAHLDTVADQLFEAAEAKGFSGGTDAAFGES